MLGRGQKNLDFEINLLPIISVLAVCLSMLLLTTVWVRISGFKTEQALGTEEGKETVPSIWIELQNDGSIDVFAKNAQALPKTLHNFQTQDPSPERRLGHLDYHLKKIRQITPDLNTALVLPAADSKYEFVIEVMDHLKKHEIKNIGIAPL